MEKRVHMVVEPLVLITAPNAVLRWQKLHLVKSCLHPMHIYLEVGST